MLTLLQADRYQHSSTESLRHQKRTCQHALAFLAKLTKLPFSVFSETLTSNIAMSRQVWGTAAFRLGETNKAKELLEQAMEYNKKPLPIVATNLAVLGNVYDDLGDAASAQELLARALAIMEAHPSEAPVVRAKILMNLGIIKGELGKPKEAKSLLKSALCLMKEHCEARSIEVANISVNLGLLYNAESNAIQARALLEYALSIMESHYGLMHPRIAIILTGLGNTWDMLGDTKQAKEKFERALSIFENHYGKDHRWTIMISDKLKNVTGSLITDLPMNLTIPSGATLNRDSSVLSGSLRISTLFKLANDKEISETEPKILTTCTPPPSP